MTLAIKDLSTRFRSAYAQDTLVRANQTGTWGTTADGDGWTQSVSTYTLSLVSNVGKLTGATQNGTLSLGSYTLADGEFSVKCVVSASGDAAGIMLRGSALSTANNCYRVRYSNGAFMITVTSGGTTSVLVTTSFSLTVGNTYIIRARAVGSRLFGRIWPDDGSAEPTPWTVSCSDTTFASGQFGVTVQSAVSTDTVSFSHFVATDASLINRDVFLRLNMRAVSQQDARMRTRIASQAIKFAHTRLRINAQQIVFLVARLVLSTLPPLQFTPLRLFLAVLQSSKNLHLRVRGNALSINVLQTRMNLVAVAISVSDDMSLRLRVQAFATLFAPLRLILATGNSRNLHLRTTVLQGKIKFLHTRLLLNTPNPFDVVARLFLMQGNAIDISWRLVVSPIVIRLRNLHLRVNVSSIATLSMGTRTLLNILGTGSFSVRLRASARRVRSMPLRLFLYNGGIRAFASRINLSMGQIFSVGMRLVVQPALFTPPVFANLPLGYTGWGDYPIEKPVQSYWMNGVPLETQPYLCTTPMTIANSILPSGSTFLLLFASPSVFTQSALASGVQGTMRFAVIGGQMVSGVVQISSTLSGDSITTLQVLVTTLADISLSTRVISTPFH